MKNKIEVNWVDAIASVFFDRSVFLASAIARNRSPSIRAANQVSKLEGERDGLDKSQILLTLAGSIPLPEV